MSVPVSAASPPTVPTRGRKRRRVMEALNGLALITPASLFLLIFSYLPLVFVVYLSFHHWNLQFSNSPFVGLHNFQMLFATPLFVHSLLISGYYAIVMVPATIILSLAIAMLLWGKFKGQNFYRVAVFIPYVTPVVATSMIWMWIFDPNYGLANTILHVFHIGPLQWLLSPTWAMPTIMINSLWHGLGFDVLVYLGGLTNVPDELMDAAKIDGASGWVTFRKVIMPIISPTTFFVLVITTISAIQVFSVIFAMTGGQYGGGPVGATTTVGFLLYQTAFFYYHFSYASAMAVVVFLIILALTVLQMLYAKYAVHYQ